MKEKKSETKYEMIFCIVNAGFSETVMDAAKEAGARGGTVIHARGTGQEKAEQFLGISLASEKDIVLIVTPTENKAQMMQAIMPEDGPQTRAGAIVFAVPVTDTAGMVPRPQSEDLEEEPEETEKPAEAGTAEAAPPDAPNP